jgi:hypothetical protein
MIEFKGNEKKKCANDQSLPRVPAKSHGFILLYQKKAMPKIEPLPDGRRAHVKVFPML